MAHRWIVLLEAAADAADAALDRGDVARLLAALDADGDGGALDSPDRYALQVTTTGSDPAEALIDVTARWADAVLRLGLPPWPIVRTEVMTPAELEREFTDCDGHVASVPGRASLGSATEHADPGTELLRRAFSDSLTGLLDLEGFEHRLETALGRTGPTRRVAVLYLDLDGFAGFVERFGGVAGDQVLVSIAERLGMVLRPVDDLVRLTGDDYAVLLDGATERGAVAVVERMLAAVRPPLKVQALEVKFSASAGVALSEPGENARTLVARAAAAVSMAREAGGDRHVLSSGSVLSASAPTHLSVTEAARDSLAGLLLMQQAAVAANEADVLHTAAEVVIRQICSHVGCAIGHLWVAPDVTSPTSSSVWHRADTNGYIGFRRATDALSSRRGGGLPGRVLTTGRPVWIADLKNDPESPYRNDDSVAGLESGFAFPVLVGREVVAVLEFFFRSHTQPTGSFLDVLVGIGTHLGRVVERQRAAAAMQHSEARLRASEARLRDTQALAHLGSWHVDLRTGESSWSDEMYSLYGLGSEGPALGLEAALATVHPADRARAQAALSRLMESGGETAEEVRIIRPDGQVRWHHVRGSVTRDESGVGVAIHGTSHDITERKSVEDALRGARGPAVGIAAGGTAGVVGA